MMSPVFVREKRSPKGTAWEFLSGAGKADYLRKRYGAATLRGDALDESVPNYAMQMRRDEERHIQLTELNDTADTLRLKHDPEANQKLRDEIQRAMQRGYDMKMEIMDKAVNHWRR